MLSRLGKGQHSLAGREDGGWAFERLIEPPPQVAMGEEVHPEQRNQIRERPAEARFQLQVFQHEQGDERGPDLNVQGVGGGPDEGLDALKKNRLVAAVVDLRLRRGSGRDVVMASPPDVPVIIFSGVPSESAELERLRPRTRLIEKPYSLVLLVETLEEMLAESGSQNLHP